MDLSLSAKIAAIENPPAPTKKAAHLGGFFSWRQAVVVFLYGK
jgi:hypothetical protein